LAADVGVEGVRKTYGDVVAVDDVDLTVDDGEFFTLLGPSGSGKTTTLRIIAGFEQPDAGRVTLGGEDITRRPPYARDVNTVFQDYALFPHMTVADNVGYGLKVKGVPRRERTGQVAQVLRMVRLEEYGKRKPVQLSGGQRQRVALARSIVNQPKVLLLDEPLAGLSQQERSQVRDLLAKVPRDVTIVMIEHDMDSALAFAERITLLHYGEVIVEGTRAEVVADPRTKEVYLGE
jgi:putative spermidine/putrescine transport system ATP-binding protein